FASGCGRVSTRQCEAAVPTSTGRENAMSDVIDVTAQENILPGNETPAPTPATPPSDSSLSSILDAALSKTETPPAEASPLTQKSPGSEESADTGRPRDEHGRFLPKD